MGNRKQNPKPDFNRPIEWEWWLNLNCSYSYDLFQVRVSTASRMISMTGSLFFFFFLGIFPFIQNIHTTLLMFQPSSPLSVSFLRRSYCALLLGLCLRSLRYIELGMVGFQLCDLGSNLLIGNESWRNVWIAATRESLNSSYAICRNEHGLFYFNLIYSVYRI